MDAHVDELTRERARTSTRSRLQKVGMVLLCLLAVEYGTFALGIPVLLRRRDWWVAGLLLLLVAYFSFTSGIIGQARFRLPIAPFYLLVGAMFIDSLLARSSQRYARGSKVPQAS